MIHVCIFEDDTYANLYPLTYSKPAYDLLIGTDTIFNNTIRYFGHGNVSLLCRPQLKHKLKRHHTNTIINNLNKGADCLFINGRTLLTRYLLTEISHMDKSSSHLFTQNGTVIAAYIKRETLPLIDPLLSSPPSNSALISQLRSTCITREIEHALVINYSWDILKFNDLMLKEDFKFYNKPGIIKGEVKPFAQIYNENKVFIDKNSIIEDFVLINAENGPVYIEENVTVEAHSRLDGPLFIGKGSKILGGRISSSSIGPLCKISGEVHSSVFQGYTNKAHGGYIGSSVIGEWVNLGAFTTTSNLKNNYSPIKMNLNGSFIQTDSLFIGSIIGDHSKTSIGTLLNTGTLIGFGSSIFDTGFHDKNIPAFSWGSPGSYENIQLDKFISTAETVMKRRHIEFSQADKELITFLYSHSQKKHV
jgi:UDP-N-acetylglucosamine diphosphorylase / glucose-1-phosphate thymidylyltransferase / UDP-N-acetylgalactosamine diphosphorylase / glucosamine-1-phosphate N-acetyltransferase / galactosamine-1-phosphate N-acetyltransferase